MPIDTSGIEKALKIVQFFKKLMYNQVHDWTYSSSPWPGWTWALDNAVDSHWSSAWADERYDEIPF